MIMIMIYVCEDGPRGRREGRFESRRCVELLVSSDVGFIGKCFWPSSTMTTSSMTISW